MVKVYSEKKKIIILGLSHENLSRLKDNQPISFNLSDLGLQDIKVLIYSRPTESDMVNDLKDGIGPETILK